MTFIKKKISPQAILALKEALAVTFWKKEELRDFIKLTITNSAIVGTLNWEATKREIVKELVERMLNRLDLFQEDLIALIISIVDINDFSHLKFWDSDGSKTKNAKQAIQNLRNQTRGYLEISKEQDESIKRKTEAEKRIIRNKSLEDELNILKEKFSKLSMNKTPQQRGFELEKFLNELFLLYELDPKGSLKNYGEQIDGSFTFDGTDYLLEAKWSMQVNRSDLASFSYKVESKLKIAMGLLISIEGVTPEAISPDFKSIIIMDGLDIISILDGRVTLPNLLYRKRRKATESGNIYVNFKDL